MSIEAKLDALTAAVTELTEVMKSGMTGKTTVAASSKDDDKSKDKDDDGDKPRTTRTRSTKAKAPTESDMKKAAESFLDKAGNDEDNYNDRRAHLKKVVSKFDAERFTAIAEGDREDALKALAAFDDKDESKGRGKDVDEDI